MTFLLKTHDDTDIEDGNDGRGEYGQTKYKGRSKLANRKRSK